MKKISIKYSILSILGIFALSIYMLYTTYYSPNAFAQTSACGTSGLQKATGLVSTPTITGSFVTSSGACVVHPRAAFAPYKIPNYDDLKSLYYDQSKANKTPINASITDATQTSLNNATQDTVYYISGTSPNGNLTLSGNPSTTTTPPPTLVVFVDGNLNFTSTGTSTGNYCYGAGALICLSTTPVAATVGTVFVVRGNVNIDPSVTRIDATIIASGTIYTAGAGCSLATNLGPNSQLVIYGSLISLTKTAPAKFCRTLDPAAAINNGNNPAEKINHQVKYLVILRNLMSDTLQRWSEIP